ELVAELGLDRSKDIQRAFSFCLLSELNASDLVTSISENEFLVFVQRPMRWDFKQLQRRLSEVVQQYAQTYAAKTPLRPRVGLSFIENQTILQAANSSVMSIHLQAVQSLPVVEAPLLVDACE